MTGDARRRSGKGGKKCPGPDGAPVEFFQQLWPSVGPLILKVINEGIEREQFTADLTLGLIVLLPKKLDQRLLTNKRPITLLNTVYKLGAKVMQRRLTPILQRIIAPQQFAFLPGRNIHHSLILLGEMLDQAAATGEEYVLLKMDVIKAFDRINWAYLLALLDKSGMSGTLSKFVKASFAEAGSAVLLNGRLTKRIPLSRSVRQGCPLSPLLFILAFDPLNAILKDAIIRGTIVGVRFPKHDLHLLQNMFADDLYLLIRAVMCYTLELQRILHCFGEATGLVCAWNKTVASAIPAGPPPAALWLLPWSWEDDENASPLLGAPTAQTIAVEPLETSVLSKLENTLEKLRTRKLALAARITVANSLLLGCIWYLIVVWAGARTFLTKLQRLIDAFVWAGRPRVDRYTIALPKAAGGLGLLGVEAQYNALTSNTMLWLLMEGDHPLQQILRGHVHQASARRWGILDLTWMFSPCGTMKMGGSGPWQNICKGWAALKKRLSPRRPVNLEEWGNLPLWRPHLNHLETKMVRCSTLAQKALRDSGFVCVSDVWTNGPGFISWHEARGRGGPQGSKAAFHSLIANLKQIPKIEPPDSTHDLFVECYEGPAKNTVWQFQIQARLLSERWLPFRHNTEPERTFKLCGSSLVPIQSYRPAQEVRLRRIIVRSPSHSSRRIRLGTWQHNQAMSTQYKWTDGTQLVNASTSQLRLLQVQSTAAPHGALNKWAAQLGRPISGTLWLDTWIPYRSAAENTFLWQMIYRIPATNKWRLPGRLANDAETLCPRCSRQTPEDTYHCLWDCPSSQICWAWCSSLLKWLSTGQPPNTTLTAAQVLIAEDIPVTWNSPKRLWHTIRAVMCWLIWKQRNNQVFSGDQFSSQRVIGLVWHRIGIYIRAAWTDLLSQVRSGRITVTDARERMIAFFGPEGKAWSLHDLKVQVPQVPPRPP